MSLLCGGAILLFSETHSHAQEQAESRDELQEAYINFRQNSPSPFATAPVTHITPSRKTFTFGLSTEYQNAVVVPDDTNAREESKYENRLTVSGWTAAPLVSYSGKDYGVGFTIEGGEREAYFIRDLRSTGGSYEAQHGVMEYMGGGAYLYALVPAKFLPRVVQLTLMGGATRMRAEHSNNGGVTSETDGAYRTYEYPVHRNQAGANMDVRLGRRFSLVVWYSYVTHKTFTADVLSADAGAEQQPQGNIDSWDILLKQEQEAFWQAQPRHRMGLDIAFRPGKFEIHLGGLLGYLASRGTTPSFILDNGLFVSFAFSRGNK